MAEVPSIGLDIAKQVFHAHGANAAGRAVFSPRIRPRRLVALQACGGYASLGARSVGDGS